MLIARLSSTDIKLTYFTPKCAMHYNVPVLIVYLLANPVIVMIT